ncbi:MAG: TolC family protein [Gemmatimonadales bacterium]
MSVISGKFQSFDWRRGGRFAIACLSGAVVFGAAAQDVAAQVSGDTLHLTLADARELSFRSNPDLAAARLDVDIARGEFRQASVLFRSNPTVEYYDEGRSGNGPEGLVGQEVEVFGQRGARRGAARAGMQRASAGVVDAARLTIGDTDRLFYQLIAAGRRTELAAEVFGLNQRLADVVQRQLDAGKVSRLEFNLATVELGRSRARALAAGRERDQVALDLARFLGIAPGTPVVPVPDSTMPLPSSVADSGAAPVAPPRRDTLHLDLDSLTALALTRRPDLAEREAATRQAAAAASVASREGLPSLSLRLLSEERADGSGQALRPGVGISVPLFNRNRGSVEAQRALARQSELRRAGLERRVRVEVARAVRGYENATAEVAVLESAVLPAARENRRLLETAYREGKVGLPVLLLIRNQVIDAELEYWAAWLAAREALADLAETTAGNLPAVTPAGQK